MYHYYVSSPTGIIPPWRTLLNMAHLRVLKVGGIPLEVFLVCLVNDEDGRTILGGGVGSGAGSS